MAVGTTLRELLSFEGVSLADLESVRLLLRGHSIVDWYRLGMKSPEEVDCFLRVNGYDLRRPADEARIRELLASAIAYLERNFHYHFPAEIRSPRSVVDLFLHASGTSEFQNLACVVLKVTHILNHIEARELRQRLAVSEDALFRLAEDRVNRVRDELLAAGAPVVRFEGGRKSRDSVLTKVLAKRSALAAEVLDRLRFRIVTRTAPDIVPILVYLKDHLLPYNYVVPGHSRNEILSLEDLIASVPALRPFAPQLQYRFQIEDADGPEDQNRFSSNDFRMINFVVDMPVRVDDLIRAAADPGLAGLGFIVFVGAEFQVFDLATFEANERGDASHERYKDRQRWEVIRRLVYGALADGGPGRGGRARS